MSSFAVFKFGFTATALTLFVAWLQGSVHQLIDYRTRDQATMAQTLRQKVRRERSRPRITKGGNRKTSPPPAPTQAAKPTGITKASYPPPPPARRPQRAERPPPSKPQRGQRIALLPEDPPTPPAEPAEPPSPPEDPEVRDAHLRKDLQEKLTATLQECLTADSPIRTRLLQGLPAMEPSGHSGLTPEEEAANRQRAIGQMLVEERQRRELVEKQRLAVAKALHFKQKMEHLRHLWAIGAGLKTILGQMSEAWEANDGVEFGRLAQIAAVEGLKPAYDILVGLPLRRFDVCRINWPLEKLDGAYTQLKASQLVDFVRGLEACGKILGAALTQSIQV